MKEMIRNEEYEPELFNKNERTGRFTRIEMNNLN